MICSSDRPRLSFAESADAVSLDLLLGGRRGRRWWS
jgi:hypothetical protein